MKKMIILMFLLLSANVVFAQEGQDITYSVGDLEYEGYFVSAGDNDKLVLILHDWDGLTGYEKERAHMLAELGYSVFAADLFGKGVRPTEVKDKRQHTGELYEDRAKMRALMNGALQTAQEKGANTDNTVVMGYCFGGAAVLELARSGSDLKGFATFHGGLKTPEGQSYKDTKGEVIVFHGTADTMIPMTEFAALADELEAAGVDHEMISYGKALHAFTVFDNRDRYNKIADERSWSRFLTFLEEKLD